MLFAPNIDLSGAVWRKAAVVLAVVMCGEAAFFGHHLVGVRLDDRVRSGSSSAQQWEVFVGEVATRTVRLRQLTPLRGMQVVPARPMDVRRREYHAT